MNNYKILLVYIIGFLVIFMLDYIYFNFIAKNFIIKELGHLLTITNNTTFQVKVIPGLLAWLAISGMVVTYVTLKYNNYQDVILNGAIFGFFIYAIYDFTNLAFLNGYTLKFSLLDILWGTFLCSMIALVSFYFYNYIK